MGAIGRVSGGCPRHKISVDTPSLCNYGDHIELKVNTITKGAYMENQTRLRDAKLVPIGNSKGIRLPKSLLQKYGIKEFLFIEETENGLLLRPKKEYMLSWEETYKAMAVAKEDWADLDTTLVDGLEDEDLAYKKV